MKYLFRTLIVKELIVLKISEQQQNKRILVLNLCNNIKRQIEISLKFRILKFIYCDLVTSIKHVLEN